MMMEPKYSQQYNSQYNKYMVTYEPLAPCRSAYFVNIYDVPPGQHTRQTGIPSRRLLTRRSTAQNISYKIL
jgi:hypothetical protein